AGEPGGQVMLPGGSQSSPGSRMALPHELWSVDDVVLGVVGGGVARGLLGLELLVLELLVLELLVVGVGAIVVDVEELVVVATVLEDVLELLEVVVVVAPGHVQSELHAWKAPAGEPGGHVMLPGGSQSSPGSMTLLPQLFCIVDEVVLL